MKENNRLMALLHRKILKKKKAIFYFGKHFAHLIRMK